MKSIFNDDKRETWKPEAMALCSEISKAISPIIKKYVELGYPVRQMQYVIHSVVDEASLEILIGWANSDSKPSNKE